jgi:ubiquinone/menaquinone biosynthesis C-methylase UbiE
MQQVANLFDSWANAGRADIMAKGHWPMVSQIIELMALQSGFACIDVGCGNGYAVRAMAQSVGPNGQVIGVDVAPKMVEQANGNSGNLDNTSFQVSVAEQLPFVMNTFHRLLSVEAIYYMPNPLIALQEWYRILKPAGSVGIMVDYYLENPYCHSWNELVDLPLHLYSENQYLELLKLAGFADVYAKRLYNFEPLDEEYKQRFKPGQGYNSLNEVTAFRTKVGSLLLGGKKAG